MILKRQDELHLDKERLNEALMLNETLFHNANGYLGVRDCYEEGYAEGFDSIRGMYINGFYDIVEMKQAENLYGLMNEKQAMVNIADVQSIKLLIEDEEFSVFVGETQLAERRLDMEMGVTRRLVRWQSPGGRLVEIEITRMASFVWPQLFTIEYKVRPVNFSGQIEFRSGHNGQVKNYANPNDPRVASQAVRHVIPAVWEEKNGITYVTSQTAHSGLSVCSAVKNELILPSGQTAESDLISSEGAFEERLCGTAACGDEIRLIKYTAVGDSRRFEDPAAACDRTIGTAVDFGLEMLYQEQMQYLKAFWESGQMTITGDDDEQNALCYNQYQLLQSASQDKYGNVSAKGLSGEGYEGHYFWDTEMYILPFFSLTNPALARQLIGFRHQILDMARENARLLGHTKGALFPWRTITGQECSGFFPAGTAQYHINGDIAYAVVQHWLLTGDVGFLAETGAEILFETARLWLDVGNYDYGGTRFVINCVTGPDEYTCVVNNNFYTNAVAKYNLQWAAKFYTILKDQNLLTGLAGKINITDGEVLEFANAAERMYLPYHEALDINPQDDSFLDKKDWDFASLPESAHPLLMHYHPLFLYRHKVLKQADTVLAHFILEDYAKPSTILNSYRYYERLTTHDSSLSICVFGMMAARLGMKEAAYGYFQESVGMDLFNTHQNTRDGIHTANMGGAYMVVVYGFGGLRIKENGIFLSPVIPSAWKGYRFVMRYLAALLEVEATSEWVTITLKNQTEPVTIYVYGEPYLLTSSLRLEMKTESKT